MAMQPNERKMRGVKPSWVMSQFDKLLCTFLILVGLALMVFLVILGANIDPILEWTKTYVSTIIGYLGGLITGRALQRQADSSAHTEKGNISVNVEAAPEEEKKDGE